MSETAIPGSGPARPRPVSSFEFWPGWIFYTPVVLFWMLLGLRYGNWALPTAANPRITTGGLCGESKSSILGMAGPVASRWIAPFVTVTAGHESAADAVSLLDRAGLSFPVVAKPDIGCNGTGVMFVNGPERLAEVLALFPRDVLLLLQAYVPHPGEAGIFYMRAPGEAQGRITSITYKQAPVLTGDGRSTLRELVMQDDRTRLIPEIYLPRLRDRLDDVPAAGEAVQLVFAGNHCKGSIFTNGMHDATEALRLRMDEILRDVPDFHFGRVDVRFDSRARLRDGADFLIIEINGVGSEATHIWDRDTTIGQAYRDQFAHYAEAFRIGHEMRRRGARTTPPLRMLHHWRVQRRLMASYPLND
ncbi:D-alanine--D-alanine ligase [Rhizosaccharibacter radicis]|uniref:D-alanine--D-alanine ligase n=1 Tax=Rhizosaccharibacter radicis TaxID=2782605 RepID=A0ABT1VYR9_9PROT|nr:D-alanine--D-alanine ligase [Acetobacteraceae bacterium KSS12]